MKYLNSKILMTIAGDKNYQGSEVSAILKWLPPPLYVFSSARARVVCFMANMT
jgi:hypothetical protein